MPACARGFVPGLDLARPIVDAGLRSCVCCCSSAARLSTPWQPRAGTRTSTRTTRTPRAQGPITLFVGARRQPCRPSESVPFHWTCALASGAMPPTRTQCVLVPTNSYPSAWCGVSRDRAGTSPRPSPRRLFTASCSSTSKSARTATSPTLPSTASPSSSKRPLSVCLRAGAPHALVDNRSCATFRPADHAPGSCRVHVCVPQWCACAESAGEGGAGGRGVTQG